MSPGYCLNPKEIADFVLFCSIVAGIKLGLVQDTVLNGFLSVAIMSVKFSKYLQCYLDTSYMHPTQQTVWDLGSGQSSSSMPVIGCPWEGSEMFFCKGPNSKYFRLCCQEAKSMRRFSYITREKTNSTKFILARLKIE